MNKVAISLVALFALAGLGATQAQDIASLEISPVVIAPAKTPLAQTIKAGLSSAYYGAQRDSIAYNEGQSLYFLYGERYFEPIWLGQGADGKITFSPAARRSSLSSKMPPQKAFARRTISLQILIFLAPIAAIRRRSPALKPLSPPPCCAMPTTFTMVESSRNR